MKPLISFLLLLAAAPARAQPIAAVGPAPVVPALPETWPMYVGVLMLCVLTSYFVLTSYASRRRFRR